MPGMISMRGMISMSGMTGVTDLTGVIATGRFAAMALSHVRHGTLMLMRRHLCPPSGPPHPRSRQERKRAGRNPAEIPMAAHGHTPLHDAKG